MILVVKGSIIRDLFSEFVKNNKVMFNFRLNGDKLDVQVLDDYTMCESIDCMSIQGPIITDDISFWVTKSAHIICGESDVEINITDNSITISQDSCSVIYSKEYEARREYPDMSNVELDNAYADRLKYLTHCAVNCQPMAKELSINYPDPVFTNNRFYLDYRQCFLVEHMMYPELCIVHSILRSFAFKLDDNTKMKYLAESSVVYFKSGNREFWVPTSNYNIDSTTIRQVDKLIADSKEIAKVSLKDIVTSLSVIPIAFPKQKLTLSVGNNSICIYADSVDSHITIGNSDNSLLMMQITSAQLEVMLRLFKDCDIVVRRGVNCLCLNSEEKTMVVTGMIY